MPAEIKVSIHGRARALPLHVWREQIDSAMQAVMMRCETISAGRVYAFECFVLLEAWHPFGYEINFLHQLAERNRGRGIRSPTDLPFIIDLRREP